MADIFIDPTTENPAYDLILDDGKERIGLVAVGNADALGRNPVETSSLKTSTGDQSFSDLMPPYTTIAQTDWTGGRASAEFEKDKTKYADALRANTERSTGVILTGREVYSTGFRSDIRNLPGSMRLIALVGTRRYLCDVKQSEFTFTAANLWVWVRRKGTPNGALTVRLRDATAGTPGAVLQTATVAVDDAPDLVSEFQVLTITDQAIASGSYYGIEVIGAAGDTDQNHWEVGVSESIGTTYKSAAGSTYTADSVDLYFRVVHDSTTSNPGVFFQYKKSLYFINRSIDGTTPALAINGVRGLAASNAGNMDKLIASASTGLANDEAVGCVIMVIEGKGIAEEINYRTITTHTDTQFTVDTDWIIEHDATTAWVILGMNKWYWIAGHGLTEPVTDVHVSSNGYVYFCQGEEAVIRRMREYVTGGAWTRDYDDEADKAVFMTEYNNSGFKIVRTNGDGTVSETDVPSSWVDLSDWQSSCAVTVMAYVLKVVTLTCVNSFSIGDRITVAGVNAGFTATNIDGDWICIAGTSSTQVVFKVSTQPTGATPQTITVGSVSKTVVKVGDVYDRITGIEAYKDENSDDAVVIFKEGGPWLWSDGAVDEMRTSEMKSVSSAINGSVSATHGSYLYFNVMNTLWRFYHPNFDDIGPPNGQGLPEGRQGPISGIVAYPGKVIISVNGGIDGYSAIFSSSGSSNWTELYRAPKGQRIRALAFQVIPGSSADRLWFLQSDLVYLPYPSDTYDPYQDDSYNFTHEFVLEFGSISSTLYMAWKYWNELQLRTNNIVKDATTGEQVTWLEADFKLAADDDWETMPDNFTEEDVEEHEFDPDFGISSQILYLRIRGYTRDQTKTPRLTAAAVSGVVVVPPKFAYQLQVQALYKNKLGEKEDIEPYMKVRKLDEWCGQARPIRVYTTNPLYHNTKVFLMPLPTRPIESAERVGEHEYQFSIILQEA